MFTNIIVCTIIRTYTDKYELKMRLTNMKIVANYILVFVIVMSILFLICFVGDNDVKAEQLGFDKYCSNVRHGIHPDYKEQLNYCN